jgi:hypothetical protein
MYVHLSNRAHLNIQRPLPETRFRRIQPGRSHPYTSAPCPVRCELVKTRSKKRGSAAIFTL